MMTSSGFSEWLRDQWQRTDAIGDLSRGMRIDISWPKKKRSLAPFSDYVRSTYGKKAIPALFNAWVEFAEKRG